jgi:hypothetical protein
MINRTIHILFLVILFSHVASQAQNAGAISIKSDSLMVISKDPKKGFHHDYILFIPKGTPLKKEIFLLVEPNNTGKISDSIEVHKNYAIDLASVSSVGNNVSTELKIPLVVPVFPRPASQPFMYTHALDRDIIVEQTPALKRIDLQLLAMITDARNILASMDINVDARIFMNGFSASGTFTNRFSLIHPYAIKALAIGGFNGELMIPQNEIDGVKLNYPIGTNDFSKLFGERLDIRTYRQLPQFIYMGKLDENDAVQFDDAYSEEERKLINDHLGATVQERYLNCQQIYMKDNLNATFRTYEKVGHWTTSEMNLEVIKFFFTQMRKK